MRYGVLYKYTRIRKECRCAECGCVMPAGMMMAHPLRTNNVKFRVCPACIEDQAKKEAKNDDD